MVLASGEVYRLMEQNKVNNKSILPGKLFFFQMYKCNLMDKQSLYNNRIRIIGYLYEKCYTLNSHRK